MTTFSLITAALTSVIVAKNSAPPPQMLNQNVANVRHHLYERILIANQGGSVVDVDAHNMSDGIHKMIDLMHKHEVDGFVLDRYALVLLYTFFTNHPVYAHDVNYMRKHTVLADITKTTKGYTYGALIKDVSHYEFLVDFVRSNREVIDSCNRLFLNVYSRKVRVERKREPLFSTSGDLFLPTFSSLTAVVLIILVCGISCELRKKKNCFRQKDPLL